jgi:hypothetical protein
MSHTASPALHADDCVTTSKDAKLDGVHDAPCETLVDIFLPRSLIEVGFLLIEEEGVYATVKMGVL